MATIRSGAIRDFPFEELSPEDFHRLALHLLDRDPDVAKVENFGAGGDDGGIDLIAEPTPSDLLSASPRTSRSLKTIVQVKRVQRFSASSARTEIERLRRSPIDDEFDRYLLITSCVPSAKAIRVLREGCRKLGLDRVEIWERSLLTSRLLKHRELLEFFFGIPDAASWSSDPQAVNRHLEVRRLVSQGHPLMLIVGSRPEFDLAPNALAGDSSPGNSLKWLIQNRVVRSVLVHGSDLSMMLGDLLPLTESATAPLSPGLWQPPVTLPLGTAVAELVSTTRQSKPVLAVMGCDSQQAEAVTAALSGREQQLAHPPLLFFSPSAGDEPRTRSSASGEAFLRSLREVAAPDWLGFHLEKVDFSRAYAFSDVLSGAPVGPGIATSGCWTPEEDDEDEPVRDVRIIKGLSGTGKTARGFRLAYRLAPQATFYLDLGSVGDVADADLGRLLLALERRHEQAVLLLDNAHVAQKAVMRFIRLVEKRSRHQVSVVAMITDPFQSLEILGGEVQLGDSDPGQEWASRRTALSRWSEEHMSANSPRLWAAERTASNVWHFFYLLRGGASTLEADLSSARREEMADVIWYMIAAHQVFHRQSATVRDILAGLTEHDLWPLTVDAGKRGDWLVRRVTALLDSRRILAVSDGFVCRHPYEALGVLRLSFDRTSSMTESELRTATVRLFSQALAPITIPEKLQGDPENFEKIDFKSFAYGPITSTLTRQGELEQAVSYDPALQEAVDRAWAPLMRLLEAWPIHPLYWVFVHGRFSDQLLRFSPFHALRELPALQELDHDGDAIDLEYVVKGMLAYEAMRQARFKIEMTRLRPPLEEALKEGERHLNTLKSLMESFSTETLVEHIPGLTDPDGTLETLTEQVEEMRESMATTEGAEQTAVTIPFKTEEGSCWTLEHSTMWLECHGRLLERVGQQIDQSKLIDSLGRLQKSRPLVLAHLWLLSPSFGRQLFAAIPDEWREEFIAAVQKPEADFNSALHLASHDDFLAVLVAELAAVSPEVAAWMETEASGEIGERIRTSSNSGIRDGKLLTQLSLPGQLIASPAAGELPVGESP